MYAPDDCPRPMPGYFLAWCRSDFARGLWLIVDSAGKIETQVKTPWHAARHVNDQMKKSRERLRVSEEEKEGGDGEGEAAEGIEKAG